MNFPAVWALCVDVTHNNFNYHWRLNAGSVSHCAICRFAQKRSMEASELRQSAHIEIGDVDAVNALYFNLHLRTLVRV